MYLLGYDAGTSSIKATLLEAQSGRVIASATEPRKEMEIISKQPGWAEQNPNVWWENVKAATARLRETAGVDLKDVEAIGITYQMHGLVLVDTEGRVLRPAIIWCDNRAVPVGEQAAAELGAEKCLKHLLNLPGNFTLARIKWVKDHEPEIYARAYKALLPGDFIALKLTGQLQTTASGLSEWIGWDFQDGKPAAMLFNHFGIAPEIIPEIVPTFSVQGEVSKKAGGELGIRSGTKVAYRAGDQPNNAFSLKVLEPGEIAATAGTSGVVYGIGDKPNYDDKSRVNTFLHVNHTPQAPRLGTLMCVAGTGCLNSWLKHNVMGEGRDYPQMNELAEGIPVGSEGLVVIPYGNSAERTLENRDIGASIHGLQFARHRRAHLLRAAQEGIVFGLNYGLQIMGQMRIKIETVRAGDANMFLSPLFGKAFATITGAHVELYNTDGSQGAARGAGIGAGIYKDCADAFRGLQKTRVIEPDNDLKNVYQQAYARWEKVLQKELKPLSYRG